MAKLSLEREYIERFQNSHRSMTLKAWLCSPFRILRRLWCHPSRPKSFWVSVGNEPSGREAPNWSRVDMQFLACFQKWRHTLCKNHHNHPTDIKYSKSVSFAFHLWCDCTLTLYFHSFVFLSSVRETFAWRKTSIDVYWAFQVSFIPINGDIPTTYSVSESDMANEGLKAEVTWLSLFKRHA